MLDIDCHDDGDDATECCCWFPPVSRTEYISIDVAEGNVSPTRNSVYYVD